MGFLFKMVHMYYGVECKTGVNYESRSKISEKFWVYSSPVQTTHSDRSLLLEFIEYSVWDTLVDQFGKPITAPPSHIVVRLLEILSLGSHVS